MNDYDDVQIGDHEIDWFADDTDLNPPGFASVWIDFEHTVSSAVIDGLVSGDEFTVHALDTMTNSCTYDGSGIPSQCLIGLEDNPPGPGASDNHPYLEYYAAIP